MDHDWQHAQRMDELARMHEVIEALKRAEASGTPRDVIDLLAYECGVREQFNKEARQ